MDKEVSPRDRIHVGTWNIVFIMEMITRGLNGVICIKDKDQSLSKIRTNLREREVP